MHMFCHFKQQSTVFLWFLWKLSQWMTFISPAQNRKANISFSEKRYDGRTDLPSCMDVWDSWLPSWVENLRKSHGFSQQIFGAPVLPKISKFNYQKFENWVLVHFGWPQNWWLLTVLKMSKRNITSQSTVLSEFWNLPRTQFLLV